MKALIYHSIEGISWENHKEPQILKQTDAIVKIIKTTICGTDLHILKGNVETTKAGTILGHEGIGEIVDLGSSVTNFKKGDKVLISCITSCGKCKNCRKGIYGHCADGGWILGNEIDGCQAEYVRIPHADNSLHYIPSGENLSSLVMLSDILPTGYEVGVLDGHIFPGAHVVIVGAGPVGLAALMTAKFFSPSSLIMIDLDENRLAQARKIGATHTFNNKGNSAVSEILEMTKGEGVDVVIEAIGNPAGWYMSEELVKAGGRIAMLGVHGKSVTLHLEKMWKKNFTFTAGLVHTTTISFLMDMILTKKLDPALLISHEMSLSEMMQGYDFFLNASREKALKIVLNAS